MIASLDWSHVIIAAGVLIIGFGAGFAAGVRDEKRARRSRRTPRLTTPKGETYGAAEAFREFEALAASR